tara:strand:+ start:243 stop:476 length:234 start_codon:yes stop_codon:yes gene_type:complete
MTKQECCRTCRHCAANESTGMSWCRLRKIRIHSDISPIAFCHHWIKAEPVLPNLETIKDLKMDRQLDFEKVFSSTEG